MMSDEDRARAFVQELIDLGMTPDKIAEIGARVEGIASQYYDYHYSSLNKAQYRALY